MSKKDKEYKLTGEVIRDLAGICNDTCMILRKHYPDAFNEEEIHSIGDRFRRGQMVKFLSLQLVA